MRAPAGELHDRGAAQAKALVEAPILDQLPPGPPGVQVADQRCGRRGHGLAVAAVGDAGNVRQVAAGLQRRDQGQRDGLAFPARDHVHVRVQGEDVGRVVGGIWAAIDRDRVRADRPGACHHGEASRMRRGGAGMPGHDDVGPHRRDRLRQRGPGQTLPFRIQQADRVARVDQRAADAQQPQRHLVPDAVRRGQRDVGWVDQQDVHANSIMALAAIRQGVRADGPA